MASSFHSLKLLVVIMTLSLFIGAGFVVYGLVGRTPHAPTSQTFSLPQNTCLHNVEFHGNSITLVYSHKNLLFFTSFSKNTLTTTRTIKLSHPYTLLPCTPPQE